MSSDGQDRADALGWGRRPNRPKTFARSPTIPQKVTNVSIYDKLPSRRMLMENRCRHVVVECLPLRQ
jgi:hypothetical protein